MKRWIDERSEVRGPVRVAVARSRLWPWLAVGLVGLGGCIDVPSRPMEGEAAGDLDPPDVGVVSDGALPEQPDPEDIDDPEALVRDGAVEGVADVRDGRPDGAAAGPGEQPPPVRFATPDAARCPDGGGLVPGVEQCLSIESAPELPAPRSRIAGVALPDGRVLVAGGAGPDGGPHDETWILEDGAWVDGPPLPVAVAGARAVAVDGGAWLVGGRGEARGATVLAVEPDGDAMRVGELAAPRESGFSVHRLGDGRVVAVGGGREGFPPVGAELLGPVAEAPGRLGLPRRSHAAAVAPDGSLWVIGGVDEDGLVRFAPEVLAPDEPAWRSVPGPAGWSMARGAAAASGATVLFAGGVDPEGRSLRRAGTYDPDEGHWVAVGGLNLPQSDLALAPIGDGGAVLAVGAAAIEVYDPVDGGFFVVTDASPLLRGEAAVVAVDGGVLVVGGTGAGRVLSRGFMVRLEPALPPADDPPPEEEDGEAADR